MKRLALKLAADFGIWTVLAVMLAVDQYALLLTRGTPAPFVRLLHWTVVEYWIWAALTPLVFWTSAKFRLGRGNLILDVPVHCAGCVAFSVLHVAAGIAAAGLSVNALKAHLLLDLSSDIWMYWTLVALWNLFDYQKRYRERATQALQLESRLAKAQLEVLRGQLQPHFLFNALNAISALMQDDVKAAEDMLADLSSMLRASLDGGAAQEVKLTDELDLLRAYIRIQRKRFEDRLQVEIEVPADILDALVPSLVLQPMVENAIRHGLAPLSRPGRIHIAAKKDEEHLVLTVGDDGRGLPPRYREGIGLCNTRERLKQLYGAEGRLQLRSTPDEGVTVMVTLPYRPAGSQEKEDEHEDLSADRRRRTAGAPANSLAALD